MKGTWGRAERSGSSSQKHNKKGTRKIAPGEVTMRNPEEKIGRM